MINFRVLESLFQHAIGTFFDKEQMLLVADANERSISHKLAEHLLRAMPQDKYGFDIDCEYNRRDLDPKRLNLDPPLLADYPSETNTSDDKGTTVYPDIIVHRRRLRENLLVIEIKKSTSRTGRDRDLKKLMEFVRHPDYCYEFGLFLEIGAYNNIPDGPWADATWYQCVNGVAVKTFEIVYGISLK